jgi:arsenite methyltransferase
VTRTRRRTASGAELAFAIDEASLWASRFGAALLDRLALGRGLRVLDVGCGTGFPAIEIAGRLGPGSRVVGVDVWREAVARARRKAAAYGVANVRFVTADGARLPFRAATFDRVTSNLGVNNFADPEAVLRECARVARPGAQLVLATNVRGHFRELYRELRPLVAALGDAGAPARLRANEAHRGSERSIRAILERTGWRVRRAAIDRFAMRFAGGDALLRHPLVRIGFLDGWRAAAGPKRGREIFAKLEARLDAIARRRGELRMTVPILVVEAERRRGGETR